MFKFQQVEIDLDQYPTIEETNGTLVIGDLHANAIKFFHLLIKHKRLRITESQYQELCHIYAILHAYFADSEYQVAINKLDRYAKRLLSKSRPSKRAQKNFNDLALLVGHLRGKLLLADIRCEAISDKSIRDWSKEELKSKLIRFDEIIEHAEVVSKKPLILLGDDMRDRGVADNLMLSIYEKLSQAQIPFGIAYSNHGLECIRDIESKTKLKRFAFRKRKNIFDDKTASQYHSFNHMALLIRDKLLGKTVIKEKLNRWLQKIKLIQYHLDTSTLPPTLSIFTHAAIGLKTIKAFTELFKCEYSVETLEKFMYMLDQINDGFEQLKSDGKIYETSGVDKIQVDHGAFIPFEFPLARTAWTRDEYGANEDEMPKMMNGFQLRFGHGHTQYDEIAPGFEHVFSLDDNLGKDFFSTCAIAKTLILRNTSFNEFGLFRHRKSEAFAASPGLDIMRPT